MSNRLVEKGLSAPVSVTWEVTTECNLSCVHCLSASGQKSALELTTSQSFQLIDEMSDLRVFRINFGGGEPFLRADFLDIVQYARDKGIVTCISTNGTVLNKDLVRSLKHKKKAPLFLQVSLDGASPEVNDSIRGQGVFERVCTAISLLAAEDIEFSINTVLTRVNYNELSELNHLARRNRAGFRVSRLRPSGRGKVNWPRLHLSRGQLLELRTFLNEFDDVRTGDSFFFVTPENRRRMGLNMCGAAKLTCSISPDGKVYPCPFLQDEEFAAGDVRSLPLGLIWRDSPVLGMFRHTDVDACRTCMRFDECRGGCPAVAYYLTRSLNRPDPECIADHLAAELVAR